MSQAFRIQAMPTFVILLNNQEQARIQGGNMAEVERQILTNIKKINTSKNSKIVASPEERNWLQRIVNPTEQVFKATKFKCFRSNNTKMR